MSVSTASLTSRQVKVTLPNQVYLNLKAHADSLGLSLSAYFRYLAIDKVQDIANAHAPTYTMSNQALAQLKKAQREEKAGKLTVIDNVAHFLDNI